MIFVTVGTELPFDRLVMAVDQWAESQNRTDVFAQIGEGGKAPKHIHYTHFLDPDEFKKRFTSAKAIIAHAGMGSILSALHHGKPIIVVPRKASLGEQRNEHQLATAKHLANLDRVTVSMDEEELVTRLDEIDSLVPKEAIGQFASESLLNGLRDFLQNA